MKAPFENGIMLLSKGVFDMKKVLSSFLIIVFAFSILTGCSGTDNTERVNLSNKVSFDVPAYWISGQHDGEEFREKLELSGNISAQDRFYASYDGPGLHLNAQHYADSFGEANDKIVNIKQEIKEFDDFSAYHFTYRFSDDDTKAELYAFDAYPDGCLTLAILSYPGSQMSDEERSDKLLEVMNSVYVIGEPDDSTTSNEEHEIKQGNIYDIVSGISDDARITNIKNQDKGINNLIISSHADSSNFIESFQTYLKIVKQVTLECSDDLMMEKFDKVLFNFQSSSPIFIFQLPIESNGEKFVLSENAVENAFSEIKQYTSIDEEITGSLEAETYEAMKQAIADEGIDDLLQ